MNTENSNEKIELGKSPMGEGNIKSQALGLISWPLQLAIFWFASTFRYSTEPGCIIGHRWYLTPRLSEWRPFILDWAPLPLCLALIAIVFVSRVRGSGSGRSITDPGPVGILICMAGFAFSSAPNDSFLFTLIGIWLCVIASVKFKRILPYSTGFAALGLIIACLFSAYTFSMHGLKVMEFGLIVVSIVLGIFSTGFTQQKRSNSAFMGAWFSFILLLFWFFQPEQLSIRTLVRIELSAAFIAGRHFYFSFTHQNLQLDAVDESLHEEV